VECQAAVSLLATPTLGGGAGARCGVAVAGGGGSLRAEPRRADGAEEAPPGVHLLVVQVPQGTGRPAQDPPHWGAGPTGPLLVVITITSM